MIESNDAAIKLVEEAPPEFQVQSALEILKNQGYDLSSLKTPKKGKKIKLVFYGDAPVVATGFGTVTRNILLGLYNTGDYDIEMFGVNYMGNPHNYPFNIYPMILNNEKDPYGREKFKQMIPDMDFDILFMVQDSFIMKDIIPAVFEELKKKNKKFKSIVYFPVDGRPKKEWIEAMASADQPVTYTEWGKKECLKAYPEIGDKLDYIYHGCNPKDFFPLPDEARQELRKKYFQQHADKFIIINLNRNQPRKDIPRTMMAFKDFKKDNPNSVLYLHMAPVDFGWNLIEVANYLGLKMGQDVLMPGNFTVNAGFPIYIVNELYNCADVCITATLGEGWGLSCTESFMTKTPFIGPDNTSLTEICADGRGLLAQSGEHSGAWTCLSNDNEIFRPLTNSRDLVKLLKKVHDNKDFSRRMTDKAYDWVLKNTTWEKHIVPKFDAHIKRLYEELQKSYFVNDAPTNTVVVKESDWKKGEII